MKPFKDLAFRKRPPSPLAPGSHRAALCGEFAIPVHDRSGSLLAYCGLTVRDKRPALIFPNGFNSACTIFNVHHITKGELYLVRDPLQALQAFESGVENVVAFLTDGICPQQFEELSSLMDERKCDVAHLYQLPKGSFFFETALKIDVHNGPPCRIKTKRQEDSPLSVIPRDSLILMRWHFVSLLLLFFER
jgi:hypothetical protein